MLRRVWFALVAISVVSASLSFPAGAWSGGLDPLDPPLACSNSGRTVVRGLRTGDQYVSLWVPNGSTLTSRAAGEMDHSLYWTFWRAEYWFDIEVVGGPTMDGYATAPPVSGVKPPPKPFSIPLSRSWTNSGPSRQVTIRLHAHRTYAGSWVDWWATLWLTPGDGSLDPACANMSDGLGEPHGTSMGMGDPIDTFSGNLFMPFSDLDSVGGADLLSFGRTYNSRDRRVESMGAGWRSWLDSKVVEAGDGVTLTLFDGARVVFPSDGMGGFSRTGGVLGVLDREVDGSLRFTHDDGVVLSYGLDGRIEAVASSDGTSVNVTRNGTGQVISVVSSLGPTLTFVYSSNRLTMVSTSDSRSVSFGYTSGRLTSSVDAAGKTTTYSYDGNGFLTKVTDQTSRVVVQSTFDARGHVLSQWSPNGGLENYTYDFDSQVITQTVAATGEQWSYHHSDSGDVVSVTDPFDKSDTRVVGTYRQWDSVTDRSGVSVEIGRDGAGNVSSVAHPGFGVTSLSYDAANRVSSVSTEGSGLTGLSYVGSGTSRVASSATNSAGKSTTRTISGGLVMSEADADGVITTYTYTSKRQLESVTVDGETTLYEYYPSGWLKSVTSPEGRVRSFTYDAMGRVASDTAPGGGVSTYAYDDAGRLVSATDPTSAVTTYTYDSVGRQASVTRPGRLAETFVYNDLGELIKVTDPSGEVTQVSYGMAGRVVSSTDQGGRETTYSYRDDGQLWKVTAPDGGVTERIYDSTGRVVTVRDPLGRDTTFGYDSAGRVTSVTDPSGAISAASYDVVGRLASVTDPTGRIESYSYTDAGRLKTVTDPAGITTTYSYDNAGRLSEATDPLTNTTTYAYTADGLVSTETSPGGLVTSFEYDDDANLISEISPSGVETVRDWTFRGELASEQIIGRGTTEYEWRPDGLLESVTSPTGGETEFGYDDAGRQTSRITPAGVESWAYDGGDLVAYTAPSTRGPSRIWQYDYDNAGRLLTVEDPTGREVENTYNLAGELIEEEFSGPSVPTITYTYTYDLAGRVTAIVTPEGTYNQQWDSAGRLTSTTPPDGRNVQYEYDTGGRRGQVATPDGMELIYVYDNVGRVQHIKPNASMTDWFTGPNGNGIDPAKWDEINTGGSTSTLQNNRVKIDVPDTPGAATNMVSRHPGTSDVTATVTFDAVSSDPANTAVFTVGLRQQASGDGYRVEYPSDTTTAALIKTVDGVDTTLGTFTLPAAASEIRTLVETSGTTIRAKAWPIAANVPTNWGISVTDTAITTGGDVTIGVEQQSGTNQFYVDGFRQRNNPAVAFPPFLTNTYNADSNLTSETFGNGDSRTYTYTDGQLTNMVETVDSVPVVSVLGYDGAGQLVSLDRGVESRVFTYDGGSQLLSDSGGAVNRSWSYDSAGRRTSHTAGAVSSSYSYNNASELTSVTTGLDTTAFTYDAAGRRTSETTGLASVSYSYDAAGRGVSVGHDDGAGGVFTQSRVFSPDGLLRHIDVDDPGGLVASMGFDWDLVDPSGISSLVGVVDGLSSFGLVGNGDRWAGSTQGGLWTTFASDVFGSVLNSSGQALADATSWDPYGVASGASSSPHLTPQLGYRGEIIVFGDVYLRAREYDPATGMFHSLDPLDDVVGTTTVGNRYHYGYNNPFHHTDPTGLRPNDCAISILGRCVSKTGLLDGLAFVGAGAAGVGCGALAMPLGPIAVGAAGSVCAGFVGRGMHRQIHGSDAAPLPWDLKSMATDAAIGGFIGGATQVVSTVVAQGVTRYQQLPRGQTSTTWTPRGTNATPVVTTGQEHHIVSRRIASALADHPTLAGQYTARDPRFVTRAVDAAAHRGYQTWHRQLDAEVVDWLARNPNATTTQFETFLHERYSQSDLIARFPNGF